MPGVWLIASTFFLTAVFYRWWVLLALLVFSFLSYLLLKRKFFSLVKKISLPVLLWTALGIYASFVLPKDFRSIIPPKTQFTLEGVVRYVSIPSGKRLLVHGKWMVVAGNRVRFPYQVWVNYMGRKGLSEDLVGEYVSLPVYFTGRDFLFYPGDYSHHSHWSRYIFKPAYYVRKGLYYMVRPLAARARTIARAVLLGIKDGGYHRIKKKFNSIGAGHILAISGLHLAILTAVVFWLPKVFGFPELVSDVLALLFVLGYMVMIPESASLFRAGVMFSLLLISRLLGRNWSIYDLLGLTILVIFFIDPQQVFSLGFWFSGLAVLSILLGFSLLPRHSFLDLWYLSLVVSLVLGPLVVKFFGCYPLVAWVINPVMIVLMTLFLLILVVYIVSFGFVGGPLLDWLARAMVFLPDALKDRTLPLCFTGLDWSNIYLYYLFLLLVVAGIGLYIIRKERFERWI